MERDGASELPSPHPSSEYLRFTPDSTTLAIATMRTVSLRSPPGADGRGQPRWAWDDIELAVHHLAFSFDSQWFAAVCDRGGIWFNQRGRALIGELGTDISGATSSRRQGGV